MFFKEHQQKLQELYPGLKLERFLKEMNSLDHLDPDFIEQSVMSGVPFQYLLGRADFFESTFIVNSDVLIPRPETEEMVDWIIKNLNLNDSLIVDVGTGSGCIGLSLGKKSNSSKIILTDISSKALEVAKQNCRLLKLDSQVSLMQMDRLEALKVKANIIVSNPPYIKKREHQNLVHKQVLEYEPGLALFLEDEKYQLWFEEFFQQVYDNLTSTGTFVMEGHELELEKLELILKRLCFKTFLKKDLSDRLRFLIGKKNG